MLIEIAVLAQELFLYGCESEEEVLVVPLVETSDEPDERGEVDLGLDLLGCGGRAYGCEIDSCRGGRWRR